MGIEKITIEEQDPVGKAIYCQIKGTNYGTMYFVCNLEKRVTQYPGWLDSNQSIKQQIIDKGYSF